MKSGRVFYATLNMGLGHASRSLPIIREFLRRGWEVMLGSNGRALDFLRRELPDCPYLETPDYGVEYAREGWYTTKLLSQSPRLLQKIREEETLSERVVAKFAPTLIMSDQCYGIRHRRVLSYFLSHQIFFAMPKGLGLFSPFAAKLNLRYHKKYSRVIIPDFAEEEGGLLSGRLSRLPRHSGKYFYSGLLSSIPRRPEKQPLDLLVSISGPEPQRTLFEKKILSQIKDLPGKKVVLLGKSESDLLISDTPDLKIYSHATREEVAQFFNQARLIVSRPGYSTLMELVELGKKALLVPTPGQTEQLYLAERMMAKRWFYSVQQDDLYLLRDLDVAQECAGLYKPRVTDWSVNNFFENLLYPNL